MHLASARHTELVGGLAVIDTERNVLQKLSVKSVTELTGGDELAFLAGQGAIIDHKGHFHGRLGNSHEFQRFRLCGAGEGVSDGNISGAREANDVSHLCVLHGLANQALDGVKRHHLGLFHRSGIMIVANRNLLTHTNGASLDAADTDSSHVIVIVDGGNKDLKITRFVSFGGGHIAQDLVKQRLEVNALLQRILGGGSRSARAIDHGAVELLIIRSQIHEKLQDLVFDLTQTSVGLVDLVDADDDSVIQLQRLLQHEASLGHGAFRRIHQQQNTVHHLENTLHLASKVGVAGGVDDIDLHAFVMHRGVLGQNGDASFLFQVSRIHYAGNGLLVFTVNAALLQEPVHQGGFSVVNVGDDGNVSQIFSDHCFLSPIVYYPE